MIRRRLFAILSAVSLMLCVATCALWVRSYHRETGSYRESGGGEIFRNDWYLLGAGRFHWTRRQVTVRGDRGKAYARVRWINDPVRSPSGGSWSYKPSIAQDGGEVAGLRYSLTIDFAAEGDSIAVWRRGI